jgi:hypothetical protein
MPSKIVLHSPRGGSEPKRTQEFSLMRLISTHNSRRRLMKKRRRDMAFLMFLLRSFLKNAGQKTTTKS